MRLLQRLTVLVFVLVFLAYTAYTLNDRFRADHTPPVITMDADVLDISVKDSPDKLLTGVTAHDDVDGDLTDRIIIRGVSQLVTDDTARVSYAVFDKADNMATAQRTVHYVDYERPHFHLMSPLIYATNAPIVVTDVLSATDLIDGDLSENIRITSQNVNAAIPGTYHITVMVTNSLGDSEAVTLPVIIDNAAAANQQIRLSQYLVYLDRGESFDPLSLLVSLKDADGNRLSPSRDAVKVIGYTDSSQPGTYQVSYTHQSYTVYVTVVVK